MRILLVDDNYELRHSTQELLESLGHRVMSAPGGAVALELARSMDFDLLITDLAMPGMDGIALAERFRETARVGRQAAILAISSDPDYPDLERFLAGPRTGFLRKPFSSEMLSRAIADAGRSKSAVPVQPSLPRRSVPVPSGRPRIMPRSTRTLHSPEDRPAPVPIRPANRQHRYLLWGLASAAALMLVTTVAVRFLDPATPQLPTPPTASLQRSAEVELIEPVGPLAELPPTFQWHAVDGAASYRVGVQAVDGRSLWTGSTTRSLHALPPELMAMLRPKVAYTWTVEALDATGTRIAWSRPTRFRKLDPEPGRRQRDGSPTIDGGR